MKIWDHCVIYTADDEEPDCMTCDHCEGSVLCSECGPEHGWHYYRREEQNYRREEQNSEMSKLVRALENLCFEKK